MRTSLRLNALGLLVAFAALGVVGCATKSGSGAGEERIASEERIADPAIRDLTPQDSGVAASRTSPGMRAELAARNATGEVRNILMDVLFDFDQAILRTDALPVLEANARRLKEDGTQRILLEGRGDEMGTSAYNLVLGERRAKAVRSYLTQLGLGIDVRTTSYGKDRPLCFEHQKECWQKNRSVHFVVKE